MKSEENSQLHKLQQIDKESISAEQLIIHNLLNPLEEQLTSGQKIADWLLDGTKNRFYNTFAAIFAIIKLQFYQWA